MKVILTCLIPLAVTACGNDDPLHAIRPIRIPEAPHIDVIASDPPEEVIPPPPPPTPVEPAEGEGEGEGEGEDFIELLLTVSDLADQDVASGTTEVGLIGWEAENLTDYELDHVFFVGELFAWIDPTDPDASRIDARPLVSDCYQRLVTDAGYATSPEPSPPMDDENHLTFTPNGNGIFEHGGGHFELHCDVSNALSGTDVYVQLLQLDADSAYRRYVDTTNAPPVIRILHGTG